jgi:anti-sigma B factor antagonist
MLVRRGRTEELRLEPLQQQRRQQYGHRHDERDPHGIGYPDGGGRTRGARHIARTDQPAPHPSRTASRAGTGAGYGSGMSDPTGDDPTGDGPVGHTGDVMTLTARRIGAAAVVTVTGELDLMTARELMTTVDEMMRLPDVGGVVVDLTAVSFLGSSGLGTLAELATRTTAPAGAEGYRSRPPAPVPPLRVVSPPGNDAVLRPWETMNLQQILPLHPDLESALQSI